MLDSGVERCDDAPICGLMDAQPIIHAGHILQNIRCCIPVEYPVRLSPTLETVQSSTVREVKERELGESR